MVVIIKSQDNADPELFRTKPPTDSADKITGSFFDMNSFNLEHKPIWNTNYADGREGGYKHYHGSKDLQMNVVLHLTGTTRYSDFQTWVNIAGGTIFYLNSDTDSNIDGNYAIVRGPIKVNHIKQKRLELNMVWEKVNN